MPMTDSDKRWDIRSNGEWWDVYCLGKLWGVYKSRGEAERAVDFRRSDD